MRPQLVALALGLILMSAQAATAQTGDGTEPCVTGHQFEPGPIVNGHRRQPTPGEPEARMRERRTRSKTSAGSGSAAPRNGEAIMLRPPSAHSPDRVVELGHVG
jgi:hypothetical protein